MKYKKLRFMPDHLALPAFLCRRRSQISGICLRGGGNVKGDNLRLQLRQLNHFSQPWLHVTQQCDTCMHIWANALRNQGHGFRYEPASDQKRYGFEGVVLGRSWMQALIRNIQNWLALNAWRKYSAFPALPVSPAASYQCFFILAR